MTTFCGKEVKNGTKVEDITLVLYGEHSELNKDGTFTQVNLGFYSAYLDGNSVVIDNEEKLEIQIKRAVKQIFNTYLLKQSEKEK